MKRLRGYTPLHDFEPQGPLAASVTQPQAFGAAVLGFVAVALTALSLTHLAQGTAIVTACLADGDRR
jgi:hypothetical protein